MSFERLGDVVDTPMESDSTDQGKVALPSVQGGIRFENVSFRFAPQTRRAQPRESGGETRKFRGDCGPKRQRQEHTDEASFRSTHPKKGES